MSEYTGNKIIGNTLLDVLLTLKQNIMSDINVAEVCKIVEIKSNTTYVVNPLNNNNKKLFCRTIDKSDLHINDIVLVLFTNTDNRLNLNKVNNNQSIQNLNSVNLHSSEYGIIITGGNENSIVIDDKLSLTSKNPVQNKVVTQALNEKLISVGEWSANKTYIPQQVVSYEGSSYVCISTVTSSTPPSEDTNHFELFVSKGDQGIQGVQGPQGPQGEVGPQGPAGSVNIDDALSTTSENAVQNKVITTKFETYLQVPDQTKLNTTPLTKNSTFTPNSNGYILGIATANDHNNAWFRIRYGSKTGQMICGLMGATGTALGYNNMPSMICPVKKNETYFLETSTKYYDLYFMEA